MDSWQFFRNEQCEWCWKHIAQNGFTLESDDCFDSRTDCIADAMRHGYLASTSAVHHRPESAPWRKATVWNS